MSATNLIVRPATPADLSVIQDLNAALFAFEAPLDGHSRNLKWPYESFGRAYFSQACAREGGYAAWVAELDGHAVGYLCASLMTRHYIKDNPVAELDNMFVEADYRRSGVGSALVAAYKDWAGEQGARRLKVGALSANHPALAFYRRHGFADIVTELEQSFGGAGETS